MSVFKVYMVKEINCVQGGRRCNSDCDLCRGNSLPSFLSLKIVYDGGGGGFVTTIELYSVFSNYNYLHFTRCNSYWPLHF